MPHHKDLHDFLVAHFKPHNLRQLVTALPNGQQLTYELPGRSVSPNELTFETVQLLREHGAIDRDFWRELKARRPQLKDQIQAIEATFPPLACVSSPTLSLILARASRREHYTEVELVIRNDSDQPQFISELRLEAQNIIVDYAPRYKLKPTFKSDHLVLSVDNRGWSDFSLDLDVLFDRPETGTPPKIVSPRVLSGEARTLAAFSQAEIFVRENGNRATLNLRGLGHAHQTGSQFMLNECIEVQRSDFSPKDLFESLPRSPDTTYVCLFETTASSCQKRYNILREVPARQADVFSCLVSTDRSASFDLVMELVSTDRTSLTARHDGLAVMRQPGEWTKLRDGDVFIRGLDDGWHLESRFPRRRYC